MPSVRSLHSLEKLWLGAGDPPPLEDRLERVSSFAEKARKLGPANFLYWDGDALFAHGHQRRPPDGGDFRPPGLYCLCRTCSYEPSTVDIEGLHVRPANGEQEVFLVASAPLTHEDWRPLDEGEIVVVSLSSSRDGAGSTLQDRHSSAARARTSRTKVARVEASPDPDRPPPRREDKDARHPLASRLRGLSFPSRMEPRCSTG